MTKQADLRLTRAALAARVAAAFLHRDAVADVKAPTLSMPMSELRQEAQQFARAVARAITMRVHGVTTAHVEGSPFMSREWDGGYRATMQVINPHVMDDPVGVDVVFHYAEDNGEMSGIIEIDADATVPVRTYHKPVGAWIDALISESRSVIKARAGL